MAGAAHEVPLAQRIVASLGDPGARCASLVGKTSLRELLALFTMAEVLVSTDSGPPHFAALTDVRCVTLFGPETPQLYGPVTPRNLAITSHLACSPCIHAWNRRVSPCDDNQCMKRIPAEEVARAALRAAEAGSGVTSRRRGSGSGSTPPSSGS